MKLAMSLSEHRLMDQQLLVPAVSTTYGHDPYISQDCSEAAPRRCSFGVILLPLQKLAKPAEAWRPASAVRSTLPLQVPADQLQPASRLAESERLTTTEWSDNCTPVPKYHKKPPCFECHVAVWTRPM